MTPQTPAAAKLSCPAAAGPDAGRAVASRSGLVAAPGVHPNSNRAKVE